MDGPPLRRSPRGESGRLRAMPPLSFSPTTTHAPYQAPVVRKRAAIDGRPTVHVQSVPSPSAAARTLLFDGSSPMDTPSSAASAGYSPAVPSPDTVLLLPAAAAPLQAKPAQSGGDVLTLPPIKPAPIAVEPGAALPWPPASVPPAAFALAPLPPPPAWALPTAAAASFGGTLDDGDSMVDGCTPAKAGTAQFTPDQQGMELGTPLEAACSAAATPLAGGAAVRAGPARALELPPALPQGGETAPSVVEWVTGAVLPTAAEARAGRGPRPAGAARRRVAGGPHSPPMSPQALNCHFDSLSLGQQMQLNPPPQQQPQLQPPFDFPGVPFPAAPFARPAGAGALPPLAHRPTTAAMALPFAAALRAQQQAAAADEAAAAGSFLLDRLAATNLAPGGAGPSAPVGSSLPPQAGPAPLFGASPPPTLRPFGMVTHAARMRLGGQGVGGAHFHGAGGAYGPGYLGAEPEPITPVPTGAGLRSTAPPPLVRRTGLPRTHAQPAGISTALPAARRRRLNEGMLPMEAHGASPGEVSSLSAGGGMVSPTPAGSGSISDGSPAVGLQLLDDSSPPLLSVGAAVGAGGDTDEQLLLAPGRCRPRSSHFDSAGAASGADGDDGPGGGPFGPGGSFAGAGDGTPMADDDGAPRHELGRSGGNESLGPVRDLSEAVAQL